jgi:hypothetical protein
VRVMGARVATDRQPFFGFAQHPRLRWTGGTGARACASRTSCNMVAARWSAKRESHRPSQVATSRRAPTPSRAKSVCGSHTACQGAALQRAPQHLRVGRACRRESTRPRHAVLPSR